ncbi:hypothetical protein ABK040_008635 [Willaertia magna]
MTTGIHNHSEVVESPTNTTCSSSDHSLENNVSNTSFRPTACMACRQAHKSCDKGRPCSRCIQRGIGHLCCNTPLRKRGRPRKWSPNSEENASDDLDSNSQPHQNTSSSNNNERSKNNTLANTTDASPNNNTTTNKHANSNNGKAAKGIMKKKKMNSLKATTKEIKIYMFNPSFRENATPRFMPSPMNNNIVVAEREGEEEVSIVEVEEEEKEENLKVINSPVVCYSNTMVAKNSISMNAMHQNLPQRVEAYHGNGVHYEGHNINNRYSMYSDQQQLAAVVGNSSNHQFTSTSDNVGGVFSNIIKELISPTCNNKVAYNNVPQYKPNAVQHVVLNTTIQQRRANSPPHSSVIDYHSTSSGSSNHAINSLNNNTIRQVVAPISYSERHYPNSTNYNYPIMQQPHIHHQSNPVPYSNNNINNNVNRQRESLPSIRHLMDQVDCNQNKLNYYY